MPAGILPFLQLFRGVLLVIFHTLWFFYIVLQRGRKDSPVDRVVVYSSRYVCGCGLCPNVLNARGVGINLLTHDVALVTLRPPLLVVTVFVSAFVRFFTCGAATTGRYTGRL